MYFNLYKYLVILVIPTSKPCLFAKGTAKQVFYNNCLLTGFFEEEADWDESIVWSVCIKLLKEVGISSYELYDLFLARTESLLRHLVLDVSPLISLPSLRKLEIFFEKKAGLWADYITNISYIPIHTFTLQGLQLRELLSYIDSLVIHSVFHETKDTCHLIAWKRCWQTEWSTQGTTRTVLPNKGNIFRKCYLG